MTNRASQFKGRGWKWSLSINSTEPEGYQYGEYIKSHHTQKINSRCARQM